MKYEEVKRILVEKGLTNYKLFEAPNYEPNNVGIIKSGSDYEVFATSERGTPAGIKKFKTEEEALDNFISRVESLNRLIAKNPNLFLWILSWWIFIYFFRLFDYMVHCIL